MNKGFNFMSKIVNRLAKAIDPDSTFKTVWDVFLTIFIFYQMVYIPLQMSFELPDNNFIIVLDLIQTFYFLADILINFHTAYSSEGLLVVDHKKIAIHYLKTWFIIDFVSSIPFDLLIEDKDTALNKSLRVLVLLRGLRLVRILRVFKVKRLLVTLKELLGFSYGLSGLFRLLKLFFIILLFAHWSACLWYYVSITNLEHGRPSWIQKFGFNDATWDERYVASLYWAVASMLTVGYGDLTAASKQEQLYNIFAILIGCGIFGYSMNQIGDIIQQINAEVSYREYFLNILG